MTCRETDEQKYAQNADDIKLSLMKEKRGQKMGKFKRGWLTRRKTRGAFEGSKTLSDEVQTF